MKKSFARFFVLMIVISMATLMSCNDNKTGDAATNNNGDVRVLQGRFVNTDNGIRSYTFKADGGFQRGAAVSGTVNGTDYDASKHSEGQYELNGDNIKLTYTDGTNENLPVAIYPSTEKDARPETPFRISIDHVTYVNRSE